MQSELNRQLRPRYVARVEERVYVSDENEPVEVTTFIEDEIHESRAEVIDIENRRVITVIEIFRRF